MRWISQAILASALLDGDASGTVAVSLKSSSSDKRHNTLVVITRAPEVFSNCGRDYRLGYTASSPTAAILLEDRINYKLFIEDLRNSIGIDSIVSPSHPYLDVSASRDRILIG